MLDAARAVQGLGGGDPVRHLARAARRRVPGLEGAGEGARGLRRDDRRLVRRRPGRRRRAHLVPRLALGLLRERPGRHRRDRRHLPLGARVARPERPPRRLGRPDRARRRPVPARARAAARQRGRLGQPGDRRRARRRGRAARRVRRDRGPREGADAAARALPDQEFAGAQVAAFSISASFFAIFLYITLYLQQILGLSPIEAGLVYLPATVLIFFVVGRERPAAREGLGRGADRGRPRARRGRPRAGPARDGDLVVGRCSSRR